MTDGNVKQVAIDNTMGAAYIGAICAGILYGVSCVQSWYYFTRYPEDRLKIKILVGSVWVLDSIHQALITHTVYHYIVTNFNNPAILERMVWSILLEVICNGLVALLVQSFLTLRLHKLSEKNWILTAIVVVSIFAGFACSLAFTATSMQLDSWAQLESLKGLSMAVNILGAVTDVLIAGSLFFYLHRSRTGFRRSDTMISKLILFVVSTGLLTSVGAIASLVSILVWSNTLIYVAFYFCLGRLYVNSLLATLNARMEICGTSDEIEDISFSMKAFSNPTSKLSFRSKREHLSSPKNLSVTIERINEYISRYEEPSPSTQGAKELP